MEPKRPFSNLDWAATPQPVKQYILYLEQIIAALADKVERILSVKQTSRIKGLPLFPILVDAIGSHFKEQRPDLRWLAT